MTNALGSNAWLVNQVSAEVVRLTHARHRLLNDPGPACQVIRFEFSGQIDGLRWALCLLKGWDPVHESGHEEKADSFIRVWHNLPGHCTEENCGPW